MSHRLPRAKVEMRTGRFWHDRSLHALPNETVAARNLVIILTMPSSHQCEYCAVVGKAEFGCCGSHPQPPELQERGATPQSSVVNVDMMKAGEKDRLKLGCCIIDTTSTICWQCHTWLCKRMFEEHAIIAVENVQAARCCTPPEFATSCPAKNADVSCAAPSC